MILYLMRHGDAEPGGSDAARGLTDWGRMQVETMAAIIARAGAPKVIVSSPLKRAVQTAEIIDNGFAEFAFTFVAPRLGLGASHNDVAAVIEEHRDVERLMIVGHMPTMGSFAASLLGEHAGLDMSTAAVACFALHHVRAPLAGSLQWFVHPGVVGR